MFIPFLIYFSQYLKYKTHNIFIGEENKKIKEY